MFCETVVKTKFMFEILKKEEWYNRMLTCYVLKNDKCIVECLYPDGQISYMVYTKEEVNAYLIMNYWKKVGEAHDGEAERVRSRMLQGDKTIRSIQEQLQH